ncbi:MAG: 16S rRNA (cytidine(1402)-2'-O)-methyltransferase [Bryobacterales bacterium]|nr:16S rRNA (cytidine(1402)-2'-O)-methyltransferase [Bryobacterales bacterium]
MPGTLYVVATPIGNLEDCSPRAVRILSEVALIACEDTRHTRKLLDHFGINTHLVSYHDHNERDRAAELALRLTSGESLALVSDAGTPLISDPGYRLVDAALDAGAAVVPIPGPNAAITALSASGLPTDAFYFGGFLAPKEGQRRRQLEQAAPLAATLIFYEAPHRILETLEEIEAICPHRPVVLARELTKLHEEFLRGSAAALRTTLAARPAIKGEFTILLGKPVEPEAPSDTRPIPEAVGDLEKQGLSRMDAIKRVARERGLPKRDVYNQVEGR